MLHHTDLVAALEWITHYFGKQFRLQVDLKADDGPQCRSFPLKVFVFRAVQELLFNVVKHSGVERASVDLSRKDKFLVVTVSDNGRGLNPVLLDSGNKPTGLGLASLRERARYIGGRLDIQSGPGRGSRFSLTVPLDIEPMDDSGPFKARQNPGAASEALYYCDPEVIRVLFVDDHKVMRHGLINLIGGQPGIHVAGEAADGLEAIEQARRLKPNVVLMDVSMPGMDGIEATRHIKAELPGVCVIGLSMHQDEQVARSMLNAGAEAFIVKTASSRELVQAIYACKQAGIAE